MKKVEQHEYDGDWDTSISLLQSTIDEAPENLNNYLFICYLLMNRLVNETCDNDKHGYYAGLVKKYFLESYCKYLHNPEYFFYMGFIASMSEWYFDIEMEEVESMLRKAMDIEPENLLYKWGYYCIPDQQVEVNTEIKNFLSMQILENDILMRSIEQKGLLGKYLKEFILSIYESTKRIL